MTRPLLLSLLVLGLASAGISWGAEPDPAVQRARQFIHRLESFKPDSTQERSAGADSLLQLLEPTELDLRNYLESHPDDPPAAVLLMRFHEIHFFITMQTFFLSGEGWPRGEAKAYEEIVERASRADTMNAELHYWRGRFAATSDRGPNDTFTENPRLPEAIRETRRAVELDPKEPKYREGLANLLLSQGDEIEARGLFRELGKDNRTYFLLHDWERMPAIEGAVFVPDPPGSMAGPPSEFFLGMEKTYLFRGTAKDLEAKCRKNWPTFRLIFDEDTTRAHGRGRRFAQNLSWKGDQLEPIASRAEVQGGRAPGVHKGGGIWMEVWERTSKAKDQPGEHPGIGPGEVYCRIRFENKRL